MVASPTPTIKEIKVSRLLGMYDYKLVFPNASNNIIIIAPNGYGKTAFLSLVNACLRFRLSEAASKLFNTLEVTFSDATRWEFTRAQRRGPRSPRDHSHLPPRLRGSRYVHRVADAAVHVTFYDRSGKSIKTASPKWGESIPSEFIAGELENFLPVRRVGVDAFLDFESDTPKTTVQIFETYYHELSHNEHFRRSVRPIEQRLFSQDHQKVNCVFIETQRLLFTRKAERPDPENKSEPQEEIVRQSQSLAESIQQIYSAYAATSQGLDRTYPNRLIALAGKSGAPDVSALRMELDQIEKRRAALTAAGILDEPGTTIKPPEGEHLATLANALKIYVEDSKTKLATFDDLFKKVSVFKELLAKKLKPKDLGIGRAIGAEVRRADTTVPLTDLSSGEKHEFIMLFRLIFETPPGSLVLIDEPEISLHVVWQLEFMEDLRRIQAANTFQSVIATHSPQVIQGNNDITIDLSDQTR